jgi:hypothetical protein
MLFLAFIFFAEVFMSHMIGAAREIKNELGQFLTSDFTQIQSLGQVGFYRGRRVEFDWQTSLAQLGIVVPAPAQQYVLDQFYNSRGSVAINLGAMSSGSVKMLMEFSRQGAVAAESYKLRSVAYDLPSLGAALRNFVDAGNAWNRHWVILTKKFVTDGFSFVLSGNRSASLELRAVTPHGRFNMADTTLNPTIFSEKALQYRIIAQRSVEPYFVVHKFVPTASGQWVLRKYAEKDIYDYIG